jgi:hypothetical protein
MGVRAQSAGVTEAGPTAIIRPSRPASVIRTRTTSIGRLAACTVSGVAVANPLRTRTVSISIVKPCANMITSVQPCGDPAISLSARTSWR